MTLYRYTVTGTYSWTEEADLTDEQAITETETAVRDAPLFGVTWTVDREEVKE